MVVTTPSAVALAVLLTLACARSSAEERGAPVRPGTPAIALAEAAVAAADHTVSFEQKGACAVGAVCTAAIRLETKAGFHVNDGFPYKFKGSEVPGVELKGADPTKPNDFSKGAGDLSIEGKTVATLAVRFTMAGKSGSVRGTYKYAICNEANCFPKEAPLALALTAK